MIYIDCYLTNGQISDMIQKYDASLPVTLYVDRKYFGGNNLRQNVTLCMTKRAIEAFENSLSDLVTLSYRDLCRMKDHQIARYTWDQLEEIGHNYKEKLASA